MRIERLSGASGSQQIRRRSDGSIDIEFYRRRAIALRGEVIAKGLRVARDAVRQWVAAAPWLARRGRCLILTMARPTRPI
jgi:hypothetical protein